MTAPAEDPLAAEDAVLYTGVVLYSTQDPEATSLLVRGGVIAWIGPEDSPTAQGAEAIRVDATGCLITPGFVDCAPTADGSAPSEDWRHQAHRRGIVEVVPGVLGQRDGMRVIAPVTDPAPLRALAAEGTPFAFGSAGDPRAEDPWSWVRAASREGDPAERISDRAAFLASTRAGHRLAGRAHPGSLTLGVEATFVVWEPWDLTVHSGDEHTNAWSVDPRSFTPMLPDLSSGAPRALRTVIDGRIVHDEMGAAGR